MVYFFAFGQTGPWPKRVNTIKLFPFIAPPKRLWFGCLLGYQINQKVTIDLKFVFAGNGTRKVLDKTGAVFSILGKILGLQSSRLDWIRID